MSEPGTVIAGRYEIVRKLGEGGMGAVYQCRQLSMDRMVAVKVIKSEVAGHGESVARFEREMKTSSKVIHENTITVYDYGESQGQLFLAMELVDGKSLGQAIEAAPFAPERVVAIGAQIARALVAAHAEGIVHRDLKPDNVMLVDRYGTADVVKVLDFGIARFLDDERANITTEGALVGTPKYMSPEQAAGRAVDHRADLYSLGCILYQMAGGRVPFESTSLTGLLVMHMQEQPRPIAELRPELPQALGELIMQLLAKSPDARPATAQEVVTRLATALATVPPTRVRPAIEGSGGKRGLIAGLAGVALAGLGVGAFFLLRVGAPSHAAIDRALGAVPPAPEACRAKGSAVTRIDKALASTNVLAALEADPVDSAEYWALKTRAAIDAARFDAVENAARTTLSLCPNWALAHRLVGNAELLAGRIDAAEKEFNAASASAPSWAGGEHGLVQVAMKRNHPQEALEKLDALVAKYPDYETGKVDIMRKAIQRMLPK